jgi:predicted permease
MILQLCRAAIRLASRVVPRPERERWRREWDGELVAWSRSRDDARPGAWRLLSRTLVALGDAWAARHERGEIESSPVETTAAGARGGSLVEDLGQDLRFAGRSLSRRPGFAAVALLTIGLGIAATTTIFSLVNGILLEPLPYPEPDRLVVVWPEQWYSQRFFEQLERDTSSYKAIAGFAYRGGILTGSRETVNGGAELLLGPRVTDGFFDVLGVEPLLGRSFAEGEDRPGRDDLLVLSHRLWQQRFGGAPEVLGRRVRLSGVDRAIVGVLPPDLELPHLDADIVFPQRIEPGVATYTSAEMKAIARLAPGVTLDEATAELQTVIPQWREQQGRPEGWGATARVVPLRDFLVEETRPGLLLLFAAVGLILIVATVNVANLLLAQALSRRQELAMRVALGAGTLRLLRQHLAESTLLGLSGGLVGLAVATLLLPFVVGLMPQDTPRLAAIDVDGGVLAFCLLLSLVTGWTVGLLPALQARGTDLRRTLASGGRGGTGGRGGLRAALVAAEVALAVLLLAGCGLLLKSFWRLQQVDPGFEPRGLLTFELIPDADRVRSAEEADRYFAEADRRLESIPGVESAATVWRAPLALDGGITFYWEAGRRPPSGEPSPVCRYRPISPDYFRTAGIPLLAGRAFTAADRAMSEPVAILSRAAAERLFPDRNALGRKVFVDMPDEVEATVIGIAGDVRMLGPGRDAPDTVYRPYLQSGPIMDAFEAYPRAFVVRVDDPATSVAAQARSTLLEIDPNAVLHELRTLTAAIDEAMTGRRATTVLLALFTGTALLLGSIGVYGVMAYTVRARTRETGIRIALGASPRDVVAGVLGTSLRIAGLGAAVGIGLALALSRVLARFVFEVEPTDPAVLLAALAIALSTAVVATLLPARRAARTDPAATLTAE